MTIFIAVADREAGVALVGAGTFLTAPENRRVLFDRLATAISGRLFSVPLYVILQNERAPQHRREQYPERYAHGRRRIVGAGCRERVGGHLYPPAPKA
ncbi:MAG: hypothetical protein OSB69_15940 [Alphaproteobacteria bacterium]|nr:hypothetical protein [Alphaproteobacteria bacterium]